MPAPTASDLEKLSDGLSLTDALTQWESAHQPVKPMPRGGFELPTRPRARWQSPAFIKSAVVIAAGLVGVLAGRQLFPRASAQSRDGIIEQPWIAVTDSVASGVNNAIYRVSDETQRTALSAADVAALIFRSPRRHTVFVDSVEARADSLLSIRGRLAANATLQLRGELRLVRRGTAELIVRSLNVDGTDVAPTMITRLVARGRARSEDSDRLRFEVPLDVTSIEVVAGAIAMTRDPYTRSSRTRVVR